MRNKKFLKRFFTGFFVLVALAIPGSSLVFENGALDLPEIASHLYAREICMCIFISGFSEAECSEITRQFIPAGSTKVNLEEKSVQVRVFWRQSKFKFKNAQLGCAIS